MRKHEFESVVALGALFIVVSGVVGFGFGSVKPRIAPNMELDQDRVSFAKRQIKTAESNGPMDWLGGPTTEQKNLASAMLFQMDMSIRNEARRQLDY